MTHRWLVSSGGRRGALVRLLQRTPAGVGGSVLVADASRLSAAGLLADSFEIVPRIADSEFVPTMLRLCREHRIRMVVPTIDTELMTYAQHAQEFAALGADVLVSSPDVIHLSMDKWELHQWLTVAGFPSAATYERAGFDPHALDGAVVAKPRSGSSSIGVHYAEAAVGLPLAALGDDYIIQQRAAGFEVTIDFAVGRGGVLLGVVPRRRLEVRAGEVSKAVTFRMQALEDLVGDLVAALPGAYGVLNVQVFVDPATNALAIIELNGRVGGGYPLSYEAGADFFTPLALGRGAASTKWVDGLVMLRFDDAAFFRTEADWSAQ